jgi:hypothetical protein
MRFVQDFFQIIGFWGIINAFSGKRDGRQIPYASCFSQNTEGVSFYLMRTVIECPYINQLVTGTPDQAFVVGYSKNGYFIPAKTISHLFLNNCRRCQITKNWLMNEY